MKIERPKITCTDCRQKDGLKDKFGAGPIKPIYYVECNKCAKVFPMTHSASKCQSKCKLCDAREEWNKE